MSGNELLAWRTDQRITQRQAADWFGCDRRTWQRMEAEEYHIPTALIRRIDLALGFGDAADALFDQ